MSELNLEEDDPGRNENGGKDKERTWEGSNGNLWSQPYVPPRRDEDFAHPLIAPIQKPTSAKKIIGGLVNPYSIIITTSHI